MHYWEALGKGVLAHIIAFQGVGFDVRYITSMGEALALGEAYTLTSQPSLTIILMIIRGLSSFE